MCQLVLTDLIALMFRSRGWMEKQEEKEVAEDNIHAGPVTGEELKLGTNH